jgi:hypothetical protein
VSEHTPPRYASLLLDDFVEPERDIVADLAAWQNPAGRDDRFTICGVPLFVQRSLELFAASTKPRKKMEATLAFSVHHGLALVSGLRGIAEIRRAREVVLASGSDEIGWFEAWHFDVDPMQTTRTKLYGRVSRETADWAGALATSLGLTRSTLATLAILAALLHVPDVPEDYSVIWWPSCATSHSRSKHERIGQRRRPARPAHRRPYGAIAGPTSSVKRIEWTPV